MSFDVLEDQAMDVLLGLDMLKRHQCLIDLRENCLHLGDHTKTRFLHENELPAHARLHGGGDAKSPSTQEQEDREIAQAMETSAHEAPQTATSSATTASSSQQQQQQGDNNQPPAANAADPKVQQLVDMGFSESDAAAELLACAGDVNLAAVRLLAKQIPPPASK